MAIVDGNEHISDLPNKRRRYDVTDRMLHLPYFLEIEKMTRQFTLDACADPKGYNAQCAQYCSLDNNFLDYDCIHHHVWINPPFKNQCMHQIILHYLKCKRQAPSTTSACILLPVWSTPSLQPDFLLICNYSRPSQHINR